MSYKFVNWSEAKPYINETRTFLMDVRNELELLHKIHLQINCVGSSKRRLITRNDGCSFDSDWDFQIEKCPSDFIENPKLLKDIIMSTINKLNHKTWTYARDSKSVITCLHKNKTYSFDVCIIAKHNNHYLRLINNKNNNSYIWNQKPEHDFSLLSEKVKLIKSKNLWWSFRETYLKHKNEELSIGDKKSSSSIYRQTINEFIDKIDQ